MAQEKKSGPLTENWSILSDGEKAAATLLLEAGQEHLFSKWPKPGTQDGEKKKFLAKAKELDGMLAQGIKGYVGRAQKLLKESRDGVNPYDGYVPTVPAGESLRTDTKDELKKFLDAENEGIKQLKDSAFVLVAGGLGERLGYNGIKVALPSDITTEVCYLDFYCRYVLAFQHKAREVSGNKAVVLPLAIMTSGDTHEKTVQLLKANRDFGMAEGQIQIVRQELVPSMLDNDARFAVLDNDPYDFDLKPHGHGDVHTLLYSSKLSDKWAKEGRKWVVFFQDTNGLVFRALPAALGVSAKNKFTVNSLTVPRKPGEAVGAICCLKKKDGASLTINVEYNQLASLFDAQPEKDRDKPDKFGYSQYPGNINVLIFDAQSYAVELNRSKGIIGEFVNPKYKDASKTTFTKPTRLECMMQDYPKCLGAEHRVGFTQFERWTAFSAVKNNLAEAKNKQKQTGFPECASSGEADQYKWGRIVLRMAGADVDVDGKSEEYAGVGTEMGARVAFLPSFAVSVGDAIAKVKGKVKLSSTSTLVVDGADVVLGDLNLDGALVVKGSSTGQTLTVANTIKNKGWSFVPVSKEKDKVDEKYIIRGYVLCKDEQVTIASQI